MTHSFHQAQHWHAINGERIQCDLCPRLCKLKDKQSGLCFVRQNQNGHMVLTTYGRSSGFCIDPIEKKPLNHFLPGTPVLSFGTAGCNLSCKFCQNWDISKSREIDKLSSCASPADIALIASRNGCTSVAFTYNDPVIFYEYAIDVANACRRKNIKSVAVSAGYICEEPREKFFRSMDAANIDLKAFSEKFYYKLTGGHLQPVLDTLVFLKHQIDLWFEITTLLIPGKNDSKAEITKMCEWIVCNLGVDVPLHFSAFHPDWKMRDLPATNASSLLQAREIAHNAGIHYVYTGNIHHKSSQSTYCPNCKAMVVGRDWYHLSDWGLKNKGECGNCGFQLAGVFQEAHGCWGAKRVPVLTI